MTRSSFLASVSQRSGKVRAGGTKVGTVPMRKVGQAELRKFFDSLASLAPASRLSHLAELSACLSVAVDHELIDRKPRIVVPSPSARQGEAAKAWQRTV